MHFNTGGWIILNPPPTQKPFDDEDGNPDRAWVEWALQVHDTLKHKGSETTANRPTNALKDGDTFLDTTLGFTITYYNGGWIDGAGNSV